MHLPLTAIKLSYLVEVKISRSNALRWNAYTSVGLSLNAQASIGMTMEDKRYLTLKLCCSVND
ncbi:hypothetical protein MNBD_GAMMA07-1935 [hydrothermal vent metagenome]|uniref:Uncharacterized protein n=1 Tax=hydrothermal vent metagenome TaxID=652676 RepID=A0A3B0WQB9_9ZZZZ